MHPESEAAEIEASAKRIKVRLPLKVVAAMAGAVATFAGGWQVNRLMAEDAGRAPQVQVQSGPLPTPGPGQASLYDILLEFRVALVEIRENTRSLAKDVDRVSGDVIRLQNGQRELEKEQARLRGESGRRE